MEFVKYKGYASTYTYQNTVTCETVPTVDISFGTYIISKGKGRGKESEKIYTIFKSELESLFGMRGKKITPKFYVKDGLKYEGAVKILNDKILYVSDTNYKPICFMYRDDIFNDNFDVYVIDV